MPNQKALLLYPRRGYRGYHCVDWCLPWSSAARCHPMSDVTRYLFLALWFGLHAFVAAQAYKARHAEWTFGVPNLGEQKMVMLSGSLLFLNVQDWKWKITGQIVPSRRSTKSPTVSYSCYIQVNLFHQPLRSWRKVRILTQLVRLPIPSCGSPINAASIWQLESFANLAMQFSEGGLIALSQSININNRFK